MAVTIALPFSFNSSGAVNATASIQRQWADRVLGVIFTMPEERVMRPSFGSLAKSAIFEPEGIVADYITRTVSGAFGQYLPELTLLDVSITKEGAELGDEYLLVSVNYELPNREEASVVAKVGTFSRTGELLQEIDNG